MILVFPQNRIQVLLSLVECDLVARFSALAESATSAVAGRGERTDALLTELEARRSYLTEMAGRKFDLWLHAVHDCAENRETYTAALCESLQRISEDTSRIAKRQLYALVFTILTALRMAGWISDGRQSQAGSSARRVATAAELFLLARLASCIELAYSERRVPDILQLAGFSGRRFMLPLPRSSFPNACSTVA